MDSLTHITLGACAGEVLLGKKLGKKALFWGALSQSLPDIDTIGSLILPADQSFLFHRGITHSFLFAAIGGVGMAFAVKRLYREHELSLPFLVFFFCLQLALHDTLDICNSYGTGLLEPFSHQRFSVNLLFVADPLFTAGLFIGTLVLIFKSTHYRFRARWALGAIGVSILYLCFAAFNKIKIDQRAEASFAAQHIARKRYFTTPAPFNTMLWYIVAAADSGYYTGYSSVWDNAKQRIDYETYPKNGTLLKQVPNKEVSQHLLAFADDYYTVSQSGGAFYFNVLRFEQVQGWQINHAPFVFSYPLLDTKGQAALLQKGRFAGWNGTTLKLYLHRIAGNNVAKQNTKTKRL
ncbi:MAG TPA: metal-dependent hydrolase [Mucilaginibacter sp.]|nr:metal-dependent hydrolase [Mucilaginibacter sp.]